jgi:hypothetical protein
MKYRADLVVLRGIGLISIVATPVVIGVLIIQGTAINKLSLSALYNLILIGTLLSFGIAGMIVLKVQRACPPLIFNLPGFIGLCLLIGLLICTILYFLTGGLSYGTTNFVGSLAVIIGSIMAIIRNVRLPNNGDAG